MTEGVPRSHRTVFLEAATNRPGRTVSQTDSGEQISPCEHEARHRQPMECDDQVVAAPRSAGVAKVVCCAATKRFCMRSSATVPLSRCSGPTLLSWRQCDSFIFHMCTARYSQASTTGSMMMIAVRGRADTCMTGLVAVLDRDGTAGTAAAPPRCGRLDIQHVPRPAQRV